MAARTVSPTHFQPPASQLAWQAVAPTPPAAQEAALAQVRELTGPMAVSHQYQLAVALAVARSAVPVETAPAHADEPRASIHYRWQARGHSYQVALDVHALPKHRVNKSLRQLRVFADAYGCGAGDAMVNSEPCLVY